AARVMHTGPDCFDYLRPLLPARRAVGRQSLSLALQMARVLGGRHPCIKCHPLRSTPYWRFLTFRNHTGAQTNPPSLDFPVAEPTPGGFVAHAHLLGLVRKLHRPRITACRNSWTETYTLRYIFYVRL